MIAERSPRLGSWAWIILGLVLIGLELVAPGIFLIWLGLAAIADRARRRSRSTCPGRPRPGLRGAVASLRCWSAAAAQPAERRSRSRGGRRLNRRGEAFVGRVFVARSADRAAARAASGSDDSFLARHRPGRCRRAPASGWCGSRATTLVVEGGRSGGSLSASATPRRRAAGRGSARGPTGRLVLDHDQAP